MKERTRKRLYRIFDTLSTAGANRVTQPEDEYVGGSDYGNEPERYPWEHWHPSPASPADAWREGYEAAQSDAHEWRGGQQTTPNPYAAPSLPGEQPGGEAP